MGRDCIDIFCKEHILIANRYVKRCNLLSRTAAAAAAKSLQSYPILCDPTDGSPLGSSVPGILQARVLEWFAIVTCVLSRVPFLATPWTVAHQAPLSMGFSRQEYWSGLPFPSPGYIPDPGSQSALWF